MIDTSKDPVNHPSHYNSGKIEVIEFIEDQGDGPGFCRGNAIKYIARAGKKLGAVAPGSETACYIELEDLKKARWYLNRLIETVEAKMQNRVPVRPNDMNCDHSKLDAYGRCLKCGASEKTP